MPHIKPQTNKEELQWNNHLGLVSRRGWSGVAKVLCILRHWGVQLIFAYSCAMLAILVTGKGRWECFYFFCFFPFIPLPLSSLFLSFISSTVSFLPFSGWCAVKPQHNQWSVGTLLGGCVGGGAGEGGCDLNQTLLLFIITRQALITLLLGFKAKTVNKTARLHPNKNI